MWQLTPKAKKFIDLFWTEWDKWRDDRDTESAIKYWKHDSGLSMEDILPEFIAERSHLQQIMADLDIDHQDIIYLGNISSTYDPKTKPQNDELDNIITMSAPTIQKALEYQDKELATEIMTPEELDKQFQLENIKRIADELI